MNAHQLFDAARDQALRRLRPTWHHLTTPTGDHAPLLASSPRRWVRRAPYAVAVPLTLILFLTGDNLLHNTFSFGNATALVLSLFLSLPVVLAVTRPLHAWWMISLSVLVGTALDNVQKSPLPQPFWIPAGPNAGKLVMQSAPHEGALFPWNATTIIAYLVVLLALGLRERRPVLVAVWWSTIGLAVLTSAVSTRQNNAGTLVLLVLSGIVLLLGWTIRDRADVRRRLAAQEQVSEEERGRRAQLEERTRIARELHDVVAHHMSVITVQADSAPYRLPDVPEDVAAEFASIAAAARESLAEMRRLLGVLRSEETATAELAPQPGLGQLSGLVDTVAQAGVRAELTIGQEVMELDPLPQAVGLSAYRIVQEALANVVRHAPGADTWVSLAAEDGQLRVTVVNGTPPRPGGTVESSGGTGHGLVGMRERVRLLDGRLDTGPLPDGGFRVAAVLPVQIPGESSA